MIIRYNRNIIQTKESTKRDMDDFTLDYRSWRGLAKYRDAWKNLVSEGEKIHDTNLL